MQQCAECKEGFQGNPVNGKQCYKQMIYDGGTYCFDPSTNGKFHPDNESITYKYIVPFSFIHFITNSNFVVLVSCLIKFYVIIFIHAIAVTT